MPIDTTQPASPFDAELAGFQFRTREEKDIFDADVYEGMPLRLERDKFNKYDAFAVAVYYDVAQGDITNHYQVGFIEKKISQMLGQWMDQGFAYDCTLIELDSSGKNRHVLRCVPQELTAELVEDFPTESSD